MMIPGLPFGEHLPQPRDTSVLVLGGDETISTALCQAGYRVRQHALDTGPLAQLAGVPFTPPVVRWPFPDASFDAVILIDELALTVREEEALAEAARVLRPGGTLLLRIPATGPLAWLDGFNAFRYAREITGRGEPLSVVAGVGWRRHYSRADVQALLAPHFMVRAMRGSGIGLSEAVRLGLLLFWRWALGARRGVDAIMRATRSVARREGRLSVAGRGYWLVTVAERRPAD